MFDRILVPLDGTKEAEAALDELALLPGIRDAQVILFQAVPIPAPDGINTALLLAESRTEAENYLSAVERRLGEQGMRALGIVRIGGEASGILDVARQHRVSLIAMTTHGRTGLSRFVYGSVAEQVLRRSQVPVLALHTIPPAASDVLPAPAPGIPIHRILMPVDGSEGSLVILPHVRDLAASIGASVMVLGVVEPWGPAAFGVGDPQVRLAVSQLCSAHIPVDPLVRLGDPASEILDASRRHHADLIAMATHGRRGVSRWINGSVTEQVLRASTIPMLTVRETA